MARGPWQPDSEAPPSPTRLAGSGRPGGSPSRPSESSPRLQVLFSESDRPAAVARRLGGARAPGPLAPQGPGLPSHRFNLNPGLTLSSLPMRGPLGPDSVLSEHQQVQLKLLLLREIAVRGQAYCGKLRRHTRARRRVCRPVRPNLAFFLIHAAHATLPLNSRENSPVSMRLIHVLLKIPRSPVHPSEAFPLREEITWLVKASPTS